MVVKAVFLGLRRTAIPRVALRLAFNVALLHRPECSRARRLGCALPHSGGKARRRAAERQPYECHGLSIARHGALAYAALSMALCSAAAAQAVVVGFHGTATRSEDDRYYGTIGVVVGTFTRASAGRLALFSKAVTVQRSPTERPACSWKMAMPKMSQMPVAHEGT
jgi:hypothetical protein